MNKTKGCLIANFATVPSNVLTVEQQAETDQIATAVNQMVASIQEVASNAQHAADAAGRADTETASGQRLVAHTSQSITALEGEIRQATQVRHCCKVSDEAAFCLIQRPYISKTLLTRRISPRGSP